MYRQNDFMMMEIVVMSALENTPILLESTMPSPSLGQLNLGWVTVQLYDPYGVMLMNST